MLLEVLVEDASGAKLLESVLPPVLGDAALHGYRIFPYKGIGRLPAGLRPVTDPRKRILLDQLPRLLRGYGKSLAGQDAAVIVLVDKDTRDCGAFKAELTGVHEACDPRPATLFRIAIEEVEAWMLGDRAAIEAAFPRVRRGVLDGYVQDSVCGTWEVLAEAIYPGGAEALRREGWPRIGEVKFQWAEQIGPQMNVDVNQSKSFQVFRDGVRRLVGFAPPGE